MYDTPHEPLIGFRALLTICAATLGAVWGTIYLISYVATITHH